MAKFIHLAGKIQEVRKTLGLKQEEFAEKLGVTRSLVARWETPSEKNRSIPKEEHLKAIAAMTPRLWETLCWFMDDGVEPGRGFQYYPDGTRILEPIFTDDQMAELHAQMAEQAQHDANPSPMIAAMINEPKGLKALHYFYQDLNKKEQIQTPEPVQKGIPENENVPSGTVEILGASVNQRNSVNRLASMVVPRRESVGEIAGGPNYKKRDSEEQKTHISIDYAEQRSTGFRTEEDDRQAAMEIFWGAVQYNLQDAEHIEDARAYFHKRINCGVIKQSLPYFDGRTLAIYSRIDVELGLNIIRMRLNRYLGDLFMAERIQNKSYKKLILFYVIGSGQVDTDKLKSYFEEVINSAQMLGVTIEFTCGANHTAQVFGKFIRDARAERG